MPSWSIHLAIAKKINNKLNLNKEAFYYGNLIPDVDKGTKLTRNNAHYYSNLPYPTCPKEKMIDINSFIKDYKDNLSDPLILGYYCHLLTDSFYNNIVYTKCWVQNNNHDIIGIKFKNNKIKRIKPDDKKRIKRKYKHRDFELYGKYLFNYDNLEVPQNKDKITNHIKFLKDNFLTNELVNKRIEYLNTDFIKFNKLSIKEKLIKHNYKLFSKDELDSLLNKCVNHILKELEKVGISHE